MNISHIKSIVSLFGRFGVLLLSGAMISCGDGKGEQSSQADEVAAMSKVLITPLSRYRVSSTFGPRRGRQHAGIDLAAPSGTTIRATSEGKKISQSWEGGCGNTVRMSHSFSGIPWVSRYCHMSSFAGVAGRYYAQGSKVGLVGSTGNSSGPHLHFELYRRGQLQNPAGWIRF
jgi:murein DD-endopeptidase MepM/ murein hydrolase activator NlpD